jgi:hypothetical protein
VIAPLRGETTVERARDELALEFAGGQAVRVVAVPWEPGERSEQLLARVRHELG